MSSIRFDRANAAVRRAHYVDDAPQPTVPTSIPHPSLGTIRAQPMRATPMGAPREVPRAPQEEGDSERHDRPGEVRPTRDLSVSLSEGAGDADSPSLALQDQELRVLSVELSSLSPREQEVLLAVCRGGTNEELASELCIALPTLRTHLCRLNEKLGTSSKSDLVRYVAVRVLRGYRTGALIPVLR